MIMWNFGITVYLYYSIVRPVCKWLLRWMTGRCELLRIVYSEHTPLRRTSRIEYSMKHSNCNLLRSVVCNEIGNIDDTVEQIIKLKSVKAHQQQFFSQYLRVSVSQITGYWRLFEEVENLRKTCYSSGIAEHEALLLQLWNALKPDQPLQSRISHLWGNIGFQGDDPATDFRGMGLLGLKNLVFFSTRYTDLARNVLSHSLHPQYGYSFAIVGINITSMAYLLLKEGHLKTHFYSLIQDQPRLEDFHLVYIHLFYEFNQFWIRSKPANIMEFNIIREKFKGIITDQLQSKCQPLQFNFQSDYVDSSAYHPSSRI